MTEVSTAADQSPTPGTLRSIAVACSPDTGRAGQIVDLAAAPEVKVRDRDRWTAYVAPDLTLALSSPDEMPSGATVSLNVKVADVRASLAGLVASGAEPAGEVVEGNHELRGAVWLSPGVALSVYQPR
ncbi:MAG: VOC family protein [Microthrixaceae bacterium]